MLLSAPCRVKECEVMLSEICSHYNQISICKLGSQSRQTWSRRYSQGAAKTFIGCLATVVALVTESESSFMIGSLRWQD